MTWAQVVQVFLCSRQENVSTQSMPLLPSVTYWARASASMASTYLSIFIYILRYDFSSYFVHINILHIIWKTESYFRPLPNSWGHHQPVDSAVCGVRSVWVETAGVNYTRENKSSLCMLMYMSSVILNTINGLRWFDIVISIQWHMMIELLRSIFLFRVDDKAGI